MDQPEESAPSTTPANHLLETTAVEVYRAPLPVPYVAPSAPDIYEKPVHSALVAMLFNVLLPITVVTNLGAAVVSYAIASGGAILPKFYDWLGNTELSLYLWIPAVTTVAVLLLTLMTYVMSLDHRRSARPVKRVHALFASFFIFMSGAALGALKVMPDSVWPFIVAALFSLVLPLGVYVLEVLAGKALSDSAQRLLNNDGANAARGTARMALRFRPADPSTEQVYGLALAHSGRAAAALPYLLHNSGEVLQRPIPVITALVDVFDALGNETQALAALEAVYRAEPSKKIFERLMKRWRALGRKDDVLRELQALPPKERRRWHETLRDLIFESGDIERCRAFCREVELSEGPPFAQTHSCYTKMLELFPDDLTTHRALIELGRRRGDADQSARLLEQVIDMDGENSMDDRRTLVSYYWTRGDRESMLRHLNAIYVAGKSTMEEKLRIVEEYFTDENFGRVEQFVNDDTDLKCSPRALSTLAHALWEQNQLEDSLDTINRIRELEPEDVILNSIASLEKSIRARMLENDMAALGEKVSDQPGDLDLRFQYYDRLIASRDVNQVVQELETLLSESPESLVRVLHELRQANSRYGRNPVLLNFMADLHLRNGEPDSAFEIYSERAMGETNADQLMHESSERVLERDADFKPALLSEIRYFSKNAQPARCLEFLDRYYAEAGEPDSSLRLLEFDAAVAAGQSARAEKVGNVILESQPEDSAFLARMAEIANDLHHFDDASDYLNRALAIDPDNEMFATLVRVTQNRQKRARIEELKALSEQGAADQSLHEELGDLYNDVGEFSAAMTEYQRASHGAPERRVARAKLGYVFARRGLHQEADETLQETELGPELPREELATLKDLFYSSAELMDRDGEGERALRVFRRVLRVEAGYKDVVGHVERLQRSGKKR